MNTKTQSAVAKTPLKTPEAKKSTVPAMSAEVSELFVAELAARRARLREILRLIRLEATREIEGSTRPAPRRGCRRTRASRGRTEAAMRAGGGN